MNPMFLGKYEIVFGPQNMTDKRRRAKEVFYEPLLTFFEKEDDVEAAEVPDPNVNLPDGIHILTLKKISSMDSQENLILLRLENIYSLGNEIFVLFSKMIINFTIDDYRIPVVVSPKLIFNGLFELIWFRETNLAGNVYHQEEETLDDTITLLPLEIKTLILKISYF